MGLMSLPARRPKWEKGGGARGNLQAPWKVDTDSVADVSDLFLTFQVTTQAGLCNSVLRCLAFSCI